MLVQLAFPPGIYANGTKLQAAGRWAKAHLISFLAGTVRPWGGWYPHSATPVTGTARAVVTWRDNSANDWIAIGTHSNLYAMNRLGVAYDITPDGFTAGNATAVIGGGYGQGIYGSGDYGESAGDPELVNPATVWSLDFFGEDLVGCSNADGLIYLWELDTGSPAAVIADAPENCRSVVVTEAGHVMVLGAAGNGRLVQWSHAQDATYWTVDDTHESGSFPLQTAGLLMCGRRTRGGTLLLTSQDAWLATYQGFPNPFSFDQIGIGCGIVSQGAIATAGTTLVAWMGRDGFWTYSGDVQPIPCDVSDHVFGNINAARLSHVTAYHRAAFGEIVWHYPSASASENNRYVAWNYREGHWSTGTLARTCGVDKGIYPYPLAIDPAGNVWRHEVGFDYTGAAAPFIESGPVQFGATDETPGERVYTAVNLVPDENTLGDVHATFYGRLYPTGPELTFGPYSAGNPTNVRFTTRHLRMRLVGARAADWRVGTFKLDIQLGGLR